jgi:hypothetical protein
MSMIHAALGLLPTLRESVLGKSLTTLIGCFSTWSIVAVVAAKTIPVMVLAC